MSGELLDRIAAALTSNGLILRGGFSFAPEEERPAGPSWWGNMDPERRKEMFERFQKMREEMARRAGVSRPAAGS